MKWWGLTVGVGLVTAYGLGRLREHSRGLIRVADAMKGQPPGVTFTAGLTGDGLRPANGASAVAGPSLPQTERDAGLPGARSAARLEALRATADALASLGTDLVDEGAEGPGLAALEGAACCLDAVAAMGADGR